MHKHALLMAATVCLAVLSGFAQTNSLVQPSTLAATPAPQKPGELGDPAPPITVLEWIKGHRVKIQPGTNFYVLIFCPLSRASEIALSNISALQKKYEDRGLITVVISEEAPQQVRDFVQRKGGEIDFTVAVDDYAGRTVRNYQDPFRQSRLPQAYVVSREGRIVWFGHPLQDDLGAVVDQVAGNRYDLGEEKRAMLIRDQLQEYAVLARNKDPETGKAGRVLLRIWTNDAPTLCRFAFHVATDPMIENRDVEVATAALDRVAQISNTNNTDIAVDRAILLFQTGHREAGLAAAKQALATATTEADKSNASNNIHAMETRIKLDQANQSAGAGNQGGSTNSP